MYWRCLWCTTINGVKHRSCSRCCRMVGTHPDRIPQRWDVTSNHALKMAGNHADHEDPPAAASKRSSTDGLAGRRAADVKQYWTMDSVPKPSHHHIRNGTKVKGYSSETRHESLTVAELRIHPHDADTILRIEFFAVHGVHPRRRQETVTHLCFVRKR